MTGKDFVLKNLYLTEPKKKLQYIINDALAAGITKEAIKGALPGLVESKLLTKPSLGVYAITEMGKNSARIIVDKQKKISNAFPVGEGLSAEWRRAIMEISPWKITEETGVDIAVAVESVSKVQKYAIDGIDPRQAGRDDKEKMLAAGLLVGIVLGKTS